jgi:very-short-patch-repair endonuclease
VNTLHLTPYIGLLVLLIAAGILAVFAKEFRARDGALSRPWPLEAKRNLLSERERALYQRLVQSLPAHVVLAQVQLLQVLKFNRGRRPYAVLNRISQLSLDFLILTPDMSPVAAIELDDVSHEMGDRRRADANKSHALKSAGIPLIRWSARNLPDTAAIHAAVLTGQLGDQASR